MSGFILPGGGGEPVPYPAGRDMDVLKVSAKSSPNAVAGAIAGILREQSNVCVQVIGAGALNQAIKAIAIARSFVEEDGLDVVCIPSFYDVDIAGESRTAIRLIVQDRTTRTVPIEPPVPTAVSTDGV